ncbi:MAG: hypothetical protein GYB20_01835 [Oceanospirillales bacterium]|nr:hypothetical protein [Oceanospirillales bacterium]
MSKESSSKKIKFVKSLHELSNSSKRILYGVIGVLLSVHIFLSLYLTDFTWLAAFGALLSIFGLLASFSYAIPIQDIDPKDLEPTEGGDHYAQGGAPMAELVTDKESIDRIKQTNIESVHSKYENISMYIIFTVLGTLIWAYAGFLNVFFENICT